MTKSTYFHSILIAFLFSASVQADTLCFSPVRKKKGDIASERPWWKPFNYRVQVDDGPLVKPAFDASTPYAFDNDRPLVKIYLGKNVVESFRVREEQLSAGRNCIYFNNLYETWSIVEQWQAQKLCSCERGESISSE